MKLNTKSFLEMEDKEREEELDLFADILGKNFVNKQKNIIKEAEKQKKLCQLMTEKEFDNFIALI